jgi:hypothetical protein
MRWERDTRRVGFYFGPCNVHCDIVLLDQPSLSTTYSTPAGWAIHGVECQVVYHELYSGFILCVTNVAKNGIAGSGGDCRVFV